MIHRFVFLFILIFCTTKGFAQSVTDDLTFTAVCHYGVVLPEYNNFTYNVNKNVTAFEISAGKTTTGKNIWEKIYNYPSYGITAFYTTLGNDRVYGREFALYPYAVFHYLKTDRFNIDHQLGVGLGYVNKIFDLESNYENIAVGSHVNIHFTMRLGLHYRFTDRFTVNAGAAFHHFSNGNLHEPNLGINSTTLYGGLSWRMGQPSEKFPREKEPYEKGHSFEFVYSFGGKHTRALQSRFYMTSSVAFEFKWHPYRAFHVGIGTDLFYDSSTEIEMQTANPIPYKKSYAWRSGIHVSQELVYNRLSLILQEGIYIGLTDQVNGHVMYNRGIIKYHITDRFFTCLSLKSHLHILDYPELGIGIKW